MFKNTRPLLAGFFLLLSSFSAHSQSLNVDETFKITSGKTKSGEFLSGAPLFVYKLVERKGKVALCGTIVTSTSIKRHDFWSRAITQSGAYVGQSKIRHGLGFMPNIVMTDPLQVKIDEIMKTKTRKGLPQLLTQLRRQQSAKSALSPSSFYGKPAKCRRTSLKWQSNIERATVEFRSPTRISYSVRY